MQKDSITTMLYRYNHARGVRKTSIHLFRHTFAKNWILNKGDPFRLKAILGHSTMAMVNVYVSMFGRDLHKDFDEFNPLEQSERVYWGAGSDKDGEVEKLGLIYLSFYSSWFLGIFTMS